MNLGSSKERYAHNLMTTTTADYNGHNAFCKVKKSVASAGPFP